MAAINSGSPGRDLRGSRPARRAARPRSAAPWRSGPGCRRWVYAGRVRSGTDTGFETPASRASWRTETWACSRCSRMKSPMPATAPRCHASACNCKHVQLAQSRMRPSATARSRQLSGRAGSMRHLLVGHPQVGVVGDRALDDSQRDRAELVVLHGGADEADGATEMFDRRARLAAACRSCRRGWISTSRRGGWPRFCTRATVSCPR